MAALTEAQLQRNDARAERQKYKNSDGEEGNLSLCIRIGTSLFYEYKPTFKALLNMIAYMTVQGDSSRAKPKQESRKKVDYDGWCWASEKTLAMRIGCSERTVQRAIAKMKKNGIVEVRQWRDSWGRPHNEYKINEQVIDSNQRDFETPRSKCEWQKRKPNKGTFSTQHQPKAIRQMGRTPPVKSPVPHLTNGPSPIRQMGREPYDSLSVEVGVSSGVVFGGVSGCDSSAYPASQGSLSSVARKSNLNLKTKTKSNPTPEFPVHVITTPPVLCLKCGLDELDYCSCPVSEAKVSSPVSQAFEIEEDIN